MLENTNMMSVYQINAQVKIQEVGKAINVKQYPLIVKRQSLNNIKTTTRADTNGRLIETGNSILIIKTFMNDESLFLGFLKRTFFIFPNKILID